MVIEDRLSEPTKNALSPTLAELKKAPPSVAGPGISLNLANSNLLLQTAGYLRPKEGPADSESLINIDSFEPEKRQQILENYQLIWHNNEPGLHLDQSTLDTVYSEQRYFNDLMRKQFDASATDRTLSIGLELAYLILQEIGGIDPGAALSVLSKYQEKGIPMELTTIQEKLGLLDEYETSIANLSKMLPTIARWLDNRITERAFKPQAEETAKERLDKLRAKAQKYMDQILQIREKKQWLLKLEKQKLAG